MIFEDYPVAMENTVYDCLANQQVCVFVAVVRPDRKRASEFYLAREFR